MKTQMNLKTPEIGPLKCESKAMALDLGRLDGIWENKIENGRLIRKSKK